MFGVVALLEKKKKLLGTNFCVVLSLYSSLANTHKGLVDYTTKIRVVFHKLAELVLRVVGIT